MNKYLKGIYFVNLLLLFSGMAWITQIQENGGFHAESITVTFGDQVWNDAIVKTASGELETRVLLFSYFNGKVNSLILFCMSSECSSFNHFVHFTSGVYQKSDYVHDGRPVYTEQNKVRYRMITEHDPDINVCLPRHLSSQFVPYRPIQLRKV